MHAGPFTIAKRQLKYLVVAIDYFTKWVEAEPQATITSTKMINFVCSFEVLICLHFGYWGQNLTTRLEMIDSFSPVSAVKDSRLTPPLPRG
jgi:hypothetical protein